LAFFQAWIPQDHTQTIDFLIFPLQNSKNWPPKAQAVVRLKVSHAKLGPFGEPGWVSVEIKSGPNQRPVVWDCET